MAEERRSVLGQDPESVHSWPYWATRATPAVRSLIARTAVGFAVIAVLLIVSVNPDVPFNWGWNTVEHVADPVPFHDFSRGGLTAMASSGSWLALATGQKRLVLFSRPARVPAADLDDDVIDVTAGLAPDSFVTLNGSSGIRVINAGGLRVTESQWLPSAPHPFWKTAAPFSPDAVVWAELDERGLFLAVRGAGVARNRFERSAGGLARTRDWVASGPLASSDLDRVIGVAPGYWLALSGGGIQFADRASLQPVAARAVVTSPVAQLAASKAGDWAAAIDTAGSAWFFRNGTGWRGPWFGPPASGLPDVSHVLAARLADNSLWMGTERGLFLYDTARRRVQNVLPGCAVRQIEVVSNRGVLAACDGGLVFVARDGKAEQIDAARPSNLHISPSGDVAVYWARNDRSHELRLRAVAQPGLAAAPVELRSGSWRDSLPAIVSVEQLGPDVLLATSSGCFTYNADGADYQDCSTAVSKDKSERRFTIGAFERVSREDGTLLAFAGGRALTYAADRTWTVLDPADDMHARRWTAVGGRALGLTADGRIGAVGYDGKPMTYVGGPATSWTASGDGPFRGDVSGNADNWRVAIAADRTLLHYSSISATWSEVAMPFYPVQVAYFEDGFAAVTPWGSLNTSPGWNEVFGHGALSFPPAQATALAAARDYGVLVGGPGGRVSRYYSNSGSWLALPIVNEGAAGAVVRLTDSIHGTLAKTSNGSVFRLSASGWESLPGVAQWLVGGDESLWTVGRAGLSVIRGVGITSTYGDGEGMRQFAERSSYVWQPEPDRIALLAPSRIGVFDRRADKWWELESRFGNPLRVLPSAAGLVIFDGTDLGVLDRSLGWRPLRVPGARPILDIAPSQSGSRSYWLLTSGEAEELTLSDVPDLKPSGRRVRVSAGVTRLQAAAQRNPEIRLAGVAGASATLAYGGQHLDWWVGADGRVGAGWRGRPDLPVWGSFGGRLTVQCIHDIASDPRNSEIILATEFGLLRRAQADFTLRSADPGPLRDLASFRRTPAPAAGAFVWTLSPGKLVVASKAGRQHGWAQTGAGWRLKADIVRRVQVSDRQLTLVTEDGAWDWSRASGRAQAVSAGPPKRALIQTPAVAVSVSDGMISFSAFDGRPALASGRFFFDSISDIQGHAGRLYVLAGGRALIRRAGAAGTITGAWPLPPSVGEGAGLAEGETGVRLVGPTGSYELRESANGAAWHPASTPPRAASTGPVKWTRSDNGWTVTIDVGGRTRGIAQWWSRGRFAWDDFLSAGAVDGGRVAISTPAGIVVRTVHGAVLSILPAPACPSSAMARSRGRLLGTLFGERLLLSASGDRLDLTPVSGSMHESPSVAFDSVPHAALGHVYAFHEEWNSSPRAALYSRVPAVPTSGLVHAGRFVFDGPSAAAVLARADVTVTGCGSSVGCLATTFVETEGTLSLAGLARLPLPLEQFMASSDGRLFALAPGSRAFRLEAASNGVRAVPERLDRTGDAFIAGDAVRLDVGRLSFSASPVHTWDRSPRFASGADRFPVFVHTGRGAAFSFDILTSVALDRGSRRLAVGSLGGVYLCPAATAPGIDLAGSCRFSFQTADTEELLATVNRVRADGAGSLWIRWNDYRVARFDGGGWRCTLSPGPFSGTTAAGTEVEFLPGAVRVAAGRYQSSNNAWWIGRTRFDRIVDSYYDAESGTLWLCDEARGLFALRVARLNAGGR